MPTKNTSGRIHVTLLGDSTLDNRIWVRGLASNWLMTRLGLGIDTSEQRVQKYRNSRFFKPDLSVIEHLRVLLPESDYQVTDGTNDGFTSGNVLSGGMRSKVFGAKTFSMFPNVRFEPLVDCKDDIQQSACIVLSLGGNDVREFLQNAGEQSDSERQQYIRSAFPQVLKQLTRNYLDILNRVRKMNSDALIIIMTQYYPSATQNTYNIYPFMSELGTVLNIGGSKHDPMDVIQSLIGQTFQGVIKNLKDRHIIIADVTSSMNPFDKQNHTSQIEPSAHGGIKIAKMLHHLMTSPVEPRQIYRFTPAFFDSSSAVEGSVVSTPISGTWLPLHPRAIAAAEEEHNGLHRDSDSFLGL